jgi:hypothetical protein
MLLIFKDISFKCGYGQIVQSGCCKVALLLLLGKLFK